MMRSLKLIFGVLLAVLTSCTSHTKFDSEHWKNTGLDGQWTAIRESMVNDLMESDTLLGMDHEELIDILGEPSISDSAEGIYKYLLREKYSYDIDPEYISYLVVEFDADNVSVIRIQK